MEVILKEDITGLGEEGDIAKVKDGYARNYLIPKKFAVINNKKNKKELETKREEIEARKAKKREEARTLEEKIRNTKIIITKKAGENGKLFGSVTNSEIAEKFQEAGLDIDRRKIEIGKSIKVIGEHDIKIKLHENVQPEISIEVQRQGEEAEKEPVNKEETMNTTPTEVEKEPVIEEEAEKEPVSENEPAEEEKDL